MVRLSKYGDRIELTPPLVVGEDQIGEIVDKVGRTIKAVATFTFTAGEGGLLKYESFRRWSRDRHGLHVFALDDLSRDLTSSGFEDFQPKVAGSVLTFSARKRPRDRAE